MILLLQTDIYGAINLANKLKEIIKKHDFGKVKNITASFGVTQINIDDDITTLLQRVDKALYISKENGRDLVTQL